MRTIALGLSAAAVLLLAASCIIAVVDPSGAPGTAFEVRKSFSFPAGGTIELHNTNGTILIRGWDEDRVELLAGERGAGVEPGRVRVAGLGSLEPKFRIELEGDVLKIASPEEADRDSVYDFELRVPRSVKIEGLRNGEGTIRVSDVFGRVEIEAERGQVQVENFSGSLDVSLTQGDVRAEVLDLRPEDEIRVEVGSGPIELSLQEPVAAEIAAESEDGRVESEIDFGQPLPAAQLEVKPEAARGRIILKTGRGDIQIRKSAA
jgi:hypothetical protein